jgi:hypothetical protein
MAAIGGTFRRFKLLEPLILQAHPAVLATTDKEKVWTRTLVCGLDAALVVMVNDDYESLPQDFRHQPQENVKVTLPAMPWLKPVYAAVVGDGKLRPLKLEPGGFTLPHLDTAEVVLLARDVQVAEQLLQRFQASQQQAGAALLRGAARQQQGKAVAEETRRVILGRYAAYAHEAAKPLAAYGAEDATFFNPTSVAHPALEWWTEEQPRGGEWTVEVPAEHAGQKHTIYFQMNRWWGGGKLRVEVLGPEGQQVAALDEPGWAGPIPNVTVALPAAGKYTVRLLQAGEGKPGGRLSRFIYVVPESAGPLPAASAW